MSHITRSELTTPTASNFKLGQKCFHCGSTSHLANACKFAKSKCFLCGKTGHLRNVRKSKSAGTGVKKPRAVRVVEEEMNLTACSFLNALNSTNSTNSTKSHDRVPQLCVNAVRQAICAVGSRYRSSLHHNVSVNLQGVVATQKAGQEQDDTVYLFRRIFRSLGIN